MAFETNLVVGIDSRKAVVGARQVEGALKRMGSAGARAARGIGGAFNRLKRSIFNVRTAVTALIAAVTGGALLRVAAEFEDLRTALKAVTGDAEAAAEAFAFIQTTAAGMPVSVQQLTRSFITLKANGIEPTIRLLTIFSDAAAVTTDKVAAFDAMTRIFARGVQGGLGLEELEQLANRGLPVYDILQEKLGKSRLELGEFGKSAAGAGEILQALATGIEERFGGSTAEALDNLSTKFSNFGDAFDRSMDQMLINSGAINLVKNAIDSLTETMPVLQAAMTTAIQSIIGFWGSLFSGIVKGGEAAFAALTGDFDKAMELMTQSAEAFGKAFQDNIFSVADRFRENLKIARGGQGEGPGTTIDVTGGELGLPPVKKVEELTEAMKEFDRVGERAFDTMSKGFTDIVTGTESVKDSFKAMAKSIIDDLIQVIIKQQIMAAFGQATSGQGFGSMLASLAGFFLPSGAGGGSMLATPVATLANGGSFTVGSSTGQPLSGAGRDNRLVSLGLQTGERVNVTPVGGGGGGGTVINIDARGSNADEAVEAAVERGIRRAAPALITASVNKVRGDRARDPNFFGGTALA